MYLFVRFFCFFLSRFGITKFVITKTLWSSKSFKTIMVPLHRGRLGDAKQGGPPLSYSIVGDHGSRAGCRRKSVMYFLFVFLSRFGITKFVITKTLWSSEIFKTTLNLTLTLTLTSNTARLLVNWWRHGRGVFEKKHTPDGDSSRQISKHQKKTWTETITFR